MSNTIDICTECGFKAVDIQFKKTKGICPRAGCGAKVV